MTAYSSSLDQGKVVATERITRPSFWNGSLLPLDECMSAELLFDLAANSVGKSHASYQYKGHQWALAIDAASQDSAYRPDLIGQLDVEIPHTWDEVMALAQRLKDKDGGSVSTPLMPIDCFPCFFTLCANFGEQAFTNESAAISRPMGLHVLGMMFEFALYRQRFGLEIEQRHP